MRILDFVRPELLVAEISGTDKPAVLRGFADRLGAGLTVDDTGGEQVEPSMIFDVLAERERLASTAIGEGVAIPHGKLKLLKRLVACVGRSSVGVDFDSVDGRPTHVFFVLLAPENSTGSHLKALARISRLFKEPEFRERLLKARDEAEMFQVIADEDAKY